MLTVDSRRPATFVPGRPGCAIIEEWTAWFLVRERERELDRRRRVLEAERARRRAPEGSVTRLRVRTERTETSPPPSRRAA